MAYPRGKAKEMAFKGCAHSSRDASCDPQVGRGGRQMVRPGVAWVYYVCQGTTSGAHARGDWVIGELRRRFTSSLQQLRQQSLHSKKGQEALSWHKMVVVAQTERFYRWHRSKEKC
ncbi:hypothetical protein NL676_024920 [Syzygium grande]|nr:hypothetical protein NL676_024920 [Syzygium grande]